MAEAVHRQVRRAYQYNADFVSKISLWHATLSIWLGRYIKHHIFSFQCLFSFAICNCLSQEYPHIVKRPQKTINNGPYQIILKQLIPSDSPASMKIAAIDQTYEGGSSPPS